MSQQRANQFVLILGLAGICWPMMMLVHECGHALAAIVTGGHVQRMIWHPLVFSRTDVRPNPNPLAVVWAGPAFGAILPAIVAACLSAARVAIGYLVTFFAGFCLIANGAYIGIGTFDRAGDAGDMLWLGTPPWIMLTFGVAAFVSGFWLWHKVSPRLGFGKQPWPVRRDDAYGVLLIAILICVVGFVFGIRGV